MKPWQIAAAVYLGGAVLFTVQGESFTSALGWPYRKVYLGQW